MKRISPFHRLGAAMQASPVGRPYARPRAQFYRPTINGNSVGKLGFDALLGNPNREVFVECRADQLNGPATIQLCWGSDGNGDPFIMDSFVLGAAEETDYVLFKIPGKTIAGRPVGDRFAGEGEHDVFIRAVYTGSHDDSSTITAVVKCSVPGGATKDDGSTPWVNENLDKVTVSPNPVPETYNLPVKLFLVGYDVREVGDVVTFEWGGHKVDYPVTAASGPITVDIPWSVVQQTGGGDIPVTWSVSDVVDNWSRSAPSTRADVQIDDGTLVAPHLRYDLNQEVTDPLDLNLLQGDPFLLRVPVSGLNLRDKVVARWEITRADGTKELGASSEMEYDTGSVTALDARVEYVVAQRAAGGMLAIWHTVVASAPPVRSKTRRYHVTTLLLPDMPVPRVPGSNNGELDPFVQGQYVLIEAPFSSDYMKLGSLVSMHVHGKAGAQTSSWEETSPPLSSGDLGKDVTFLCPATVLQAVENGAAEFNYDVSAPSGGGQPIASARSETLLLQIRRGGAPSNYPPPVIDDVKSGVLDPSLPSTLVRIPAPAAGGPASGTEVGMSWVSLATYQANGTVPAAGELTFRVDKAYIDGNRGNTVAVTYNDATRRVSDAAQFVVGVAVPSLPAPGVAEADANDEVNPITSTRLNVLIPSNATFQPGDTLDVSWDDGTPGGSQIVNVTQPRPGISVPIDTKVLAYNQGGGVAVSYAIHRDGSTLTSDIYMVTVPRIHDDSTAMPRPLITEGSDRDLDLATFAGDAHVTVAPFPLISTEQRHWVTVTGKLAQGGAMATFDVSKGLRFTSTTAPAVALGTIDRSWLENLADRSTVTIDLWVTFDGSTNKATAVHFRKTDLTLHTGSAAAFHAPQVTEAESNGTTLIPYKARNKLNVYISSRDAFVSGDVMEVQWTGSSTGGTRVIKVPNTPTPGMSIAVDPVVLAFNHGGQVTVTFTVLRNGTLLTSPPLQLTVQRIPDASADWPRPIVTQGPDRELDLAGFSGDADVTIEAYPLMATGQRHWVTVTGKLAQGGQTTTFDVSAGVAFAGTSPSPIALGTIDRTWLQSLTDKGTLTIDLWVTFDGDTNKTGAVHFRKTDLTLKLAASGSFRAPRVTEAESNGTTLIPIKAQRSLTVYISSRDTFLPGDALEVQWTGSSPGGTRVISVPQAPTPGMSVPIDPTVLAFNHGGKVTVTFTVKRAGAVLTSPPLTLSVQRIPDQSNDWPRAIVTEGPDYTLDLTKFTGDAHVTVVPFPFIAVGQLFWVEAIGVYHQQQTKSYVATARPFPTIGGPAIALGNIPRSWLNGLDHNSPLDIQLWVAFDGSTNRNNAVIFRHTRLTVKQRGGNPQGPRGRSRAPADPQALPPPIIQGAPGGSMPAWQLAQGFSVSVPVIPRREGMPAATTATLSVLGRDASSSIRVGPIPWDTQAAWWVDSAALHANVGGKLTFNYVVDTPGAPIELSEYVDIKSDLPRDNDNAFTTIQVEGISGSVIDLGLIEGDVTLVQAPYMFMKEGQSHWLTVRSDSGDHVIRRGQPITRAELQNGIREILPRTWLETLPSRSMIIAMADASFGDPGKRIPMNVNTFSVLHDRWESTCDFEDVRGSPSVRLGGTLVVDGWMDLHFNHDTYTGSDNRLGIDNPGHAMPGFYEGNMVYLGHPSTVAHKPTLYIKFHRHWKAVSLVITSLNSRARVLFEGPDKEPLVSYEIVGSDPAKAHEVQHIATGSDYISYMIIEADDVIRLDTFRFR